MHETFEFAFTVGVSSTLLAAVVTVAKLLTALIALLTAVLQFAAARPASKKHRQRLSTGAKSECKDTAEKVGGGG